jgi:tetratricopeptide (TPR) repeat protein
MENKNIVIFGVLITILIGGFFIIFPQKDDGQENENNTNTATSTTSNEDSEGISFDENLEGTKNLPPKAKVPNLDRSVTFPEGMNTTSREKIKKDIETLIKTLKEGPNTLAPWIELGILRKSIEDYEGAKEAWEFAKVIRPGDWIAYHNLSDLYGYYLHDNAQSEKNILLAIEKAPTQAQLYVKASEIYLDVFGDTKKAIAIVEKGLKALPGNTQLLSLKKSLESL